MNCTEAQLKAQAIIDNELEEQEIGAVISHMETCYTCREEYINLLRLQRKIGKTSFPDPPKEWFEGLSKNRYRNTGNFLGRIAFFGSYICLFIYFLIEYFTDSSESLFLKVSVGGIITGVLILFMVTLYDRIRESKNDKYSEVEK